MNLKQQYVMYDKSFTWFRWKCHECHHIMCERSVLVTKNKDGAAISSVEHFAAFMRIIYLHQQTSKTSSWCLLLEDTLPHTHTTIVAQMLHQVNLSRSSVSRKCVSQLFHMGESIVIWLRTKSWVWLEAKWDKPIKAVLFCLVSAEQLHVSTNELNLRDKCCSFSNDWSKSVKISPGCHMRWRQIAH